MDGVYVMVTGHRPPKIGGYDPQSPLRRRVRAEMHRYLDSLLGEMMESPMWVEGISGMALGVDQEWARMCIRNGIPVTAYVPGRSGEQASRWPEKSQREYLELLEQCEEVISVEGEWPYVLQRRNEAMVDAADRMLAVWDGSPGGTWNCINYMMRKWYPGCADETMLVDLDRVHYINVRKLRDECSG